MAPRWGPRLPPELCYDILDFLAPESAVAPENFLQDLKRIRALVACARVSREWLPRAQMHLYSSVRIGNLKQTLNLISTLTARPALSSNIRRVLTIPTGDNTASTYLPLTRLFSMCPSLEYLALDAVQWSGNHPPNLTSRLGSRTAITHLELRSSAFSSIVDFLHIIRSFRHLITLSVVATFVPSSAPAIAEMQARRACWAPATLRALDLRCASWDSAGEFVHLFGDAIERFTVELAPYAEHAGHVLGHYLDRISSYQSLTALHVVLGVQRLNGLSPAFPEDIREEYQAMRDRFVGFLRAVRAPALRSLVLTLSPCSSHVSRGAGYSQWYGHTRVGALGAVLDPGVRDVLVEGAAFRSLERFEVVVEDDSSVHDAGWWEHQIVQHLPGMRAGIIRAMVHYHNPGAHGNPLHRTLWRVDADPMETLLARLEV